MVLTREEYVAIIRENYPDQRISLTELIEFLILTYGTNYTMPTNSLDNILDLLLGESKDLAFVITNDPFFSKKLCYYFNTQLGEGFITKNCYHF